MISSISEFAQEATATQALAAAITSGTDSSGRPLVGPSAASFTAAGGARGGAGGKTDDAASTGTLAMEDADEGATEGGAGAGGGGTGRGPSKAAPRRNHQELEELARWDTIYNIPLLMHGSHTCCFILLICLCCYRLATLQAGGAGRPARGGATVCNHR